jgi:hypothetical protein
LTELQDAGEEFRHLDTGRSLRETGIKPVAANVYLGGWAIAEALAAGADIVICPRVTDASLVLGPAAWHFGWSRDDWDRLAGAVVAGHVIECGAQATGGNYSFFQEVPGLTHCGFPIAELYEDGSSVITKHEGQGGMVSVGTVTAQLLYEIQGHRYLNPDVTVRFDTIELTPEGRDRVRISGTRGEPASDRLKVSINYLGGFRNAMTFVLTGPDVEAKAELARRQLFEALGGEGRFGEVAVQLIRADEEHSSPALGPVALLQITVKDSDSSRVGREFSSTVIEMALASYPGFFTTASPQPAAEYGVFWPALVSADEVTETVVLEDGRRVDVRGPRREKAGGDSVEQADAPRKVEMGRTRRLPLGTIVGARSGDKGGNANVGLWARSEAGYEWLNATLTVSKFKALLPEAADLEVRRYPLPNLHAINFVVAGLLGDGVASSTRFDAQAKGLSEHLRSRIVEIPEDLLSHESTQLGSNLSAEALQHRG